MKVIKGAIVLALFLGCSEAISVRSSSIDNEYEDKVIEEEDNLKSKHSKDGIEKKLTELTGKDVQLIQDYKIQLDQSQRNIN